MKVTLYNLLVVSVAMSIGPTVNGENVYSPFLLRRHAARNNESAATGNNSDDETPKWMLASIDFSKPVDLNRLAEEQMRASAKRTLVETSFDLTVNRGYPGNEDESPTSETETHTLNVNVPDGWTLSPPFYPNSRLLGDTDGNQVKVLMEPRADHQDALDQIPDLVAFAEETQVLPIGGWPAVQSKYRIVLPPPGNSEEGEKEALLVATYVAYLDNLIQVTSYVEPDAEPGLIQLILTIGQSLGFEAQGDEATVTDEIAELQAALTGNRYLRQDVKDNNLPPPARKRRIQDATSTVGANERISQVGFGELEIASSPDGRNIVVALQSRRFVQSNDFGATFANTVNPAQIGSGNGDPSIAWAQSGAFYIAWIDTGCGSTYASFVPAGNPNGSDCTGMSSSTDDGVTFQTNTVNPAVECAKCDNSNNPPGCCFPDQEHIAADRVNAGSGGDQVYSVWRNFDASDQDAALVCTEDSAVNWSAPLDLGSGSFFPRITVGQDGIVYVAAFSGANYRIWKFNSCANGLGLLGTFPRTVAPRNPYKCPFAGHDRCDQNPSSQTVAVDDTDPNHIYYAYAQDAGLTDSYSNIFVRDSLDGGTTWSGGRQVQASTATSARRIFPWLCTTGGDATVTWYESAGPFPLDTVHHVAGRVGLDDSNNLVSKETFTISEVPDFWCNAGWPCGTRQGAGNSEQCPVQPQNAGRCSGGGTGCDFSDCGGVGVPSTGPPCACPLGATCDLANGCPKYGDYNGNACAAGKLFAAWPSLESPDGVVNPTSFIGVLFDVVNLAVDLPAITVPGPITLPDACIPGSSTATLDVCNTGQIDLQVDEISSDTPSIEVTLPSSGWPVTISKDFCFPFQVTFNPAGTGEYVATLTIPSNDPGRPRVEVQVTGTALEPNLVTVLVKDFGDVCLGNSKTQALSILNDGACVLEITNVAISSDPEDEFKLATIMDSPFFLQAGESVEIEIEFSPKVDVGAAGAILTVSSNIGNKVLNLEGNSPSAVIDAFLANSGEFGDVCEGDLRDLDLTISNNGACPLSVDSISVSLGSNAQANDFAVPSADPAGTVVSSGNSVRIPIRFAPANFDNDPPLLREATVDISSRTLNAATQLSQVTLDISGTVPPPDIQVAIVNSGDFGDVCKGDSADLSVTLFNQGKCDLTISAISIEDDSSVFQLPDDVTYPLVLSPDADFPFPVRFSPVECSDVAYTGLISIASDDPDEGNVDIEISGMSPCPDLIVEDLAGMNAFPATVVDSTGTLGCYEQKTATLRNAGQCPLTIDSIVAEGPDFTVTEPTNFPIILPSGEETLRVTVRFAPTADADPLAPSEVTGELEVESDDPDSPSITPLCGESVAQSGVRILVTETATGVPVEVNQVKTITIKSSGIHTPSPVNLRFTAVPLSSATVCERSIKYHIDQESLPSTDTTGNNPSSSYTYSAQEGNLKASGSFTLGQCEFRDFQIQFRDSDAVDCLLKAKGESCITPGECCSGKCTGPKGGKTCK